MLASRALGGTAVCACRQHSAAPWHPLAGQRPGGRPQLQLSVASTDVATTSAAPAVEPTAAAQALSAIFASTPAPGAQKRSTRPTKASLAAASGVVKRTIPVAPTPEAVTQAGKEFWSRVQEQCESGEVQRVLVVEATELGLVVSFDLPTRPRRGFMFRNKCGALLQVDGGVDLVGQEISAVVQSIDKVKRRVLFKPAADPAPAPPLRTAGTPARAKANFAATATPARTPKAAPAAPAASAPATDRKAASAAKAAAEVAAAAKPVWSRYPEGALDGFKVGQLVSAVVRKVSDKGAAVDLDGTGVLGRLGITHLSGAPVTSVSAHLAVGQQLKAAILLVDVEKQRVLVSTRMLEAAPGDMLTNPQLVMDGAEEVYALSKATATQEADVWRRMSELQAADSDVKVVVTEVSGKGLVVTYDQPPRRGFIRTALAGSLLQGEGGAAALVGQEVTVRVAEVNTMKKAVLFRAADAPVAQRKVKVAAPPAAALVPARAVKVTYPPRAPSPKSPKGAMDAFQVGQLVSGVVLEVNKLGASITLDGGSGAIGSLRLGDLSNDPTDSLIDYLTVGQALKAVILSKDREGEKLRLSTRQLEATPGDMLRKPQLVFDNAEAMLAQQRAAAAALGPLLEAVQVGQLMPGVVETILPYGALVNLGSLTGLLHVSELSAKRIDRMTDHVTVGQQIKVLCIAKDLERGRLKLSTRQLEATPGDMLTSPQLVFDGAEKVAAAWRLAHN